MFHLKMLLGMTAGTLTTISFFPQLMRVAKTKSTHDISLGMFVIFCTGIILWIAYGFLLDDIPLIISNVVTLILAGAILYYKLRYK